MTSSSELYHGDANHDYSAARGQLDTVETTANGVQHMGAWSANFNNMLQNLQVGDWHTCMHALCVCVCVRVCACVCVRACVRAYVLPGQPLHIL